jgi:hypothetical protein
MQTFLPYPSFKESEKCLDMKRLGKQRVECLQILKALFGLTSGWANHPATVMWKGSEGALVDYSLTICEEWIRRGYNDTCVNKIITLANEHIGALTGNAPKWLGNPDFHASHRSNLLRKNPIYYGKFGWEEDDALPYIWGNAND